MNHVSALFQANPACNVTYHKYVEMKRQQSNGDMETKSRYFPTHCLWKLITYVFTGLPFTNETNAIHARDALPALSEETSTLVQYSNPIRFRFKVRLIQTLQTGMDIDVT